MESKLEEEEPTEVTPEELKEMGNQCVKENNFKQAIKYYSEGLRKSIALGLQDMHILFSNRSFAYLKDKKYFYALSDAEKAIELKPDWLKGYYRKAEVLKECCLYDEAILSYGRSLKLEPTNSTILSNLRQTAALCNRENMLEKNVPFVGAGCGVIFAIVVVIFDQLTKKPSMSNPMLMVTLVMIIAGVGFGIAKLARFLLKLQRKGFIQEPSVLCDDFLVFEKQMGDQNEDEQEEMPKKRNRYSKSQARLRFKKGKS